MSSSKPRDLPKRLSEEFALYERILATMQQSDALTYAVRRPLPTILTWPQTVVTDDEP